MQDREEMSPAEVTGRGCMSDRMRPIKCQAIVGVDSSDWTLSEAVTGHTDDTVLHHDNVFSMTEHSGTNRPDIGNAASDRVQRGSRAAPA